MISICSVRPAALALAVIACAIAGCSGSGGTGSAVPASTATPVPSSSPTASPTPTPGPTFAPSTSCNLQGQVTDIGPGANNTYQVSVAVGPANTQGIALTNLKIRFGFVNTSFVSASTPTAPTTFDPTTLTWTIGALPASGGTQSTIVLTFTQLPPASQRGTTFMEVHEQASADQCFPIDVLAFETNL
jgi:hypothetical protein